jgi:predicted DNA-binding protein
MPKKMKTPMVRTTIYLPERVHEGMKVMALLNGTTMADLLRDALQEVYEEQLEHASAARETLAGMKKHPGRGVDAKAHIAKKR